jgi:hypothetical protein
MKNSMRITMGVVGTIFAVSGFCFGQTETSQAKAKEITVTGVASKSTETNNKASNDLWITEIAKEQVNDQIELKKTRVLNFINASKKSEVKINVTEDQNWLSLKIHSYFETGSVLTEILDPTGAKIGTFTVKTEDQVNLGENTTTRENVTAEFVKVFRFPKTGEWIIRALPTSASGSITININQAYIPSLTR